MKNSFIILIWFVCCIGSVISGVITYYLTETQDVPLLTVTDTAEQRLTSPGQDLSELGQVQGMQTTFETDDARPQIVANFITRYNSPLKPAEKYGQLFVDIADKYELDFRLLPAIAMQESGLCKAIPPGGHNCLGFGIHSKGTLGFESYEEGFEAAAKGLKKNYIDQGRTTPEEIMKKYTPSSNGSWANSVNQWMAEMRYDDRQLGRELKQPGANVLEFVEASPEATPESSPSNQ